jgi:hypothetical protein
MILALGLALAGCAPQGIYYKATATPEDVRADTYSCERDTRMAAYSFESGGMLYAAIESRNFYNRCLEAKGYVWMAR